jgi:hypothetical protein
MKAGEIPAGSGGFDASGFDDDGLHASGFDGDGVHGDGFNGGKSVTVGSGGDGLGSSRGGPLEDAALEPVWPAPAVRPFLLTAGRVAGGQGLVPPIPVETQVVATEIGVASLDTFAFEHHDIVAVCRRPQSLAEIAAKLRLHLTVIRVLADDLRADGQLALYSPQADSARDVSVLRRVIDGLRAVPDSRGVLRD